MIAHCDIKSDNILLRRGVKRLVIVLTDFGISRILQGKRLIVAGFQNFQVDGASYRYASPEALKRLKTGEDHEPHIMKAGDIYGWSMITFEMITALPPWTNKKPPPVKS